MRTARIRTIAGVVWLEMLRRKDIYVLLMLMGVIVVSLFFINVFNISGVTAYVKDTGLLLVWVFAWILAVTVSARELPHEEGSGTIYSLLAKPITRLELILGKWLGAWTIVVAATFCFYCLLMGVVYLHGGAFRPILLVQGFLLHAAALAVICALGLALSTRMNYDAAATFCFAVTIGAFLILPKVPEFLMKSGFETTQVARTAGEFDYTMSPGFEGVQYYALIVLYSILPHFELFDMRQALVHQSEPASWQAVAVIVYYGLHMSVVFLLAAWIGYARKRFSRGEMK